MSILATLCFASTAFPEVRRADGKIVMEESDYRFFITRIKALEAETSALKEARDKERASFDVYMAEAEKERRASIELADRLQGKIRSMENGKWLPGVIAGGGPGTDGGVQGFVGVGWKIDLW